MDKFEQGGCAEFPVSLLASMSARGLLGEEKVAYIVLSLLETASELYTRGDKRWERVPNSLATFREITSSRLQKLVCQLDCQITISI